VTGGVIGVIGVQMGAGLRGKNQAEAMLARMLVVKTTEVSCILIEEGRDF